MVQFTNALEYMMVTPLFPLMADALGQDVSQAGYVASSYTFASVIAGLIGFFFLDRLPKKRMIIVCLIMIGLLTSIIPAIKIFSLLLLIRFVTGLFGGILLATAMALLLDLIPEAMRGKMIALVLTAFPLVSIAGLPFILWLAEVWQWQLAFYLLASIFFCLCAFAGADLSNIITNAGNRDPLAILYWRNWGIIRDKTCRQMERFSSNFSSFTIKYRHFSLEYCVFRLDDSRALVCL